MEGGDVPVAIDRHSTHRGAQRPIGFADEYAASKKGGDPGSTSSTTALCRPEDVRSDGTKVPEMRLVIALFGMFPCIVSNIEVVPKIIPAH